MRTSEMEEYFMPSSAFAVLAISYGLVFALFGYPIFRVLLPIYGGIIGYWVGLTIIAPDYPMIALVVGLGLAILFASMAYLYWSVMIGVAGAILGYCLVAALVSAIWPESQGVSWWAALAGALVGCLVFVSAKDLMVVITSALNGAMIVAWGLSQWLNPRPLRFTWDTMAMFTFFAVAILGLIVQYRFFGRERKYASERPADVRS